MSFPTYADNKETGDDWLDEVPAHWEFTPLRRLIVDGVSNGLFKKKDEFGQGTLLLNVFDVYQNDFKVKHDQLDRVTCTDEENASYEVLPNDLFFVRSSLKQEGVAVVCVAVECEEPVVYECHLIRARPDSTALGGRFASYVLNSAIYRAKLIAKAKVTTMTTMDQESIVSIQIPVPPLDEQKAISSFLDVETSKIDGLVSEQRRLIELLKEKRQAVISHAVTKGLNPNAPMKPSGIQWLGDVPQHWTVSRIKFMVQPNDGIQMGPFGGMLLDLDGVDTGFKVFGQENTISGDFTRGQRWISQERYAELERYAAKNGDLVLTRKGSLGNARLIVDLPQPGIIDSDTIRVRVDNDIVASRFLAKLLHEAPYIAEQITRKKRGAILPGLNTSIIANLVVVLPNRDEQDELLSYLDSESLRFNTLQAEAERAIELLQERRTALISAAVTGKIDVREFAYQETA